MSRIIVVTGTDTEIGKTFVTRSIVTALRARGVDVRAVKPVESGTIENAPENQDGVLLAQAAGQAEPKQALQLLREPLAPPDAAELEGAQLDYEGWLESIEQIASGAEITLVEGAGGLLSPLTWTEHALSLAARIGAEVLVVAPDKLGVQNHVRLVLRALESESVNVLGVVLSAPEMADRATGRNQAVLERVTSGVRFATVARHGSPAEAASDVAPVLEWLGYP